MSDQRDATDIDTLFLEQRRYPPPLEFAATANAQPDIYDRDPWVALSLYKALCRAKDYSYRLLEDAGSPKASLAWLQPLLEEEQAIIGKDWYPYGIEQNRPSIEALLQYSHEQGLSKRHIKIEELFAPSTLRDIPLSEGQHV
jgi:4,5-dihydroxyphthalate decarboxylase